MLKFMTRKKRDVILVSPMTRLLFVCLGNICRSPAAEGIMLSMIEEAGLNDRVSCDSCGTSAYHIGEPADARMQDHAGKRGYRLLSRARPFNPVKDFDKFDYIFAMDQSNYDTLIALAARREHKDKVYKMTSFCSRIQAEDVPDPYYRGEQGFERVLDILEDACQGVLDRLLSRRG